MEITHLSSTVQIKTVEENPRRGIFEVEGLYAGYGLTIGNALRRVLLSSLPGAAVTYLKVKNVSHEFSSLPGVKEDIVELSLNFKKLRFRMHTDEPQVLVLKMKGEGAATGADIKPNSQAEVVNPEEVLATVTSKDAELEVELTVERGLGYSDVASRKSEKLAIGLIGVDAFFSPVRKVNYTVQDMRVGDRTDYNRLSIEIDTDGTISPSQALHKAASILRDHFDKALAVPVQEFELQVKKEEAPKKRGRAKKIEDSK